ncbi:hypothetical protein HOP50_11g64730 [Chloropicon primus]|uniref:EF-hand domain-containing protein n=1 Tax=Chloropicon primus TaxID=1764295 RepID=A0A5B8MWC0_9CHLO|nr:hypothetical protein A3770_11p64530 [Chloropicon primus]UPR03146.1 hypothetical protein HOP50_11g64730 [Chloropicon primus]|eukprot:QDZ23935.1 hypothetical protein A3770_11p64530 [Chloropicon primus]
MIGLVSKMSGKTKTKLKEVRHREEDPVKCILNFYQFLELHLKHRVKAKMGRSLKVDHMTMRHITKSSQVVYGANQSTQKVEMSTATTTFTEIIRPIFEHYCSYGEKHNYVYMRRGQFLKFARDCRLMNETTDLTELNLIFQKINAQSKKSGDHEQRLSLYEFYLACELIATRIYPGKELEDCLRLLYDNNVSPYAQTVPRIDHRGDALMRPGVLEVVRSHQKQLRAIFDYYSKMDQVYGRSLSWKDITHHQNHISINEFLKFAADFAIIPDLLTKSQLTRCFREANFGPKRTSHDTTRLTFPEFEDCLGRCALLGFGYVTREEDTIKEAKFTSNYSEAAKTVWMRANAKMDAYKFYKKVNATANARRKSVAAERVEQRNIQLKRRVADTAADKEERDENMAKQKANYYPEAGLPAKYHPFTAQMVKMHKMKEEEDKQILYYFHSLKRLEAAQRLKDRVKERENLEKRAGLPNNMRTKWPTQFPPVMKQLSMTLPSAKNRSLSPSFSRQALRSI